jgi:hypothetical protein
VTECAAGKYKTAPLSAAACTLCAGGKYKASAAQTSDTCESCPANSNSPTGSDASNDCTCTTGWSGPNGDTCLKLCASGQKRSGITCEDCEEGTYKGLTDTATSCVGSCLANSNSPAGSDSDTACLAHSGYTGSGNTIAECAAGKYKAAPLSTAPCDDCGSGKYSESVALSDPSGCKG